MKSLLSFLLILFLSWSAKAQQSYLENLQSQLSHSGKETNSRVLALGALADYYGFIQYDSCILYSAQTLALAQKLQFYYGMNQGYFSRFHGLNCQGNYPEALQAVINLQQVNERLIKDSPWVESMPYYLKGVLYREMGEDQNAIDQLEHSISVQEKAQEPTYDVYYAYAQLGMIFTKQRKLDSAFHYARMGYNLGVQSKKWERFYSLAIGAMGNYYVAIKNYGLAAELYRKAITQSGQYNNFYFQATNYNNLAAMYNSINMRDSCIYYAGISIKLCRDHNFARQTSEASQLLYNAYESSRKLDSALKYMKIWLQANDSVIGQSKVRQFQLAKFNEIQHAQDLSISKERYQEKVRFYGLLVALGVFFVLGFVLYWNIRQGQKAKVKIEKAYDELKATQDQLIQSEKMASLGELTAGIAHEIQNPLNFVNNFSEVNKELIEEMKLELANANLAGVKSIIENIEDNEDKILHHGKRADAIVKGMLQHSRASTGQKELTDINALADEYLRLSYHGLRAKDKSFNATMQTDFDENVGKIYIIPQDIGRVLLNLFNNAFYAISEKKKHASDAYEPTIWVNTKRTGDKVEIGVKDNGNGIPQKVQDKIFLPFFTTKPTGFGTGLGLSMSYDIVKAHGGKLQVRTREGEYAEFIIELPT
jgi:two-component system, NtrC family, sensor kinase